MNTRTGAPRSKKPKNVKKIQKLGFKLDKYAECHKVRSQSAHETNQKRNEPGLKQSRDRIRSMRRKIQTRGFDLRLTPQQSSQFLL
jgi:hypothetical protein